MSPRSGEINIKTTSLVDKNESLSDQMKARDGRQIVWLNVFIQAGIHLAALYGVYLCFYAKYQTLITSFLFFIVAGLGITAGAHRLWSHRSYKAKLPLRIFLGFLQTMAGQNSIYEWSRDHRVHHKHVETDADPHNSRRGFFFSHMGWLMLKKHPQVIEKGKQIPLDDLMNDVVVRIQHKYYVPLFILCNFIFPTTLNHWLWNESLLISYFVSGILRYVFSLHVTWSVNSFAHMFGHKPYDKGIKPSENIFVSIAAIGEGFHNFHHVFPNDYSTSEFSGIYFNFTRVFIDFFYMIGQVTDRKKTSHEMVMNRKKRTGELSEENFHENENIDHEY